jgi:glucokinase
MKTLAIDIGGTNFSIATFDGDRMIHRQSHATDRAGGREVLLSTLEPLIAGQRFDRCGIGFGGPVDWAAQKVVYSTHVPGWRDFDFPAWLRERLGDIPVAMDRDTQAAALGEYLYGAGRCGAGKACSSLFYMTISTGIGGAIMIDGQLRRGVDSWAGEIGHINVRPDGPPCLCGSNGCLERMCCGLWLERDYGRPAHQLLRDPAFVERYVVDLARGIKAALMLLNPERVVIGGGIAKAGDALFLPLRSELGRQFPPWSKARVDIQPAALRGDSVLWGAKALSDLSK